METLANLTGDLNSSPSSITPGASDITEEPSVTEPVDHVRSTYYFPEQLFMASDVYYVENFKTVNWELPQWYAYKGLKLRHHNTYNLPLNRGRKISLYFSFTVGITISNFISGGRKPSRLLQSFWNAGGIKKETRYTKAQLYLRVNII